MNKRICRSMEMKMIENALDIDSYMAYAQEIFNEIYYDPDSPGYMDSDKTYEIMQERL